MYRIQEREENMKYEIAYTIQIEAKDRSEARRMALQGCPSEDYEVAVWELDEADYKKGRII